jgi:DNA (cytosine-5)-methyltransferase 1
MVGRSRNKGNEDYKPEEDRKQTLYREYLQIIADHWPAVFVMENVKGLLSAKLKDQRIFDRIIEDLRDPAESVRRNGKTFRTNGVCYTYNIYAVARPNAVQWRSEGPAELHRPM